MPHLLSVAHRSGRPLAGCMLSLALVVLVVLAATPAIRADATIEGRVALPAAARATVPNQRYEVVSQGGVFATNPPLAVIYLEGEFPAAPAPATATITQKELRFHPAVLPVRAGTRVQFPNEDDNYHNIFSYSAPKRFDLGRYRPDERPIPSVVFDQPGLVVLRCEIHEHMRGLVLVLDTPHFTTSAVDGSYRLAHLPAGRYVLKAWRDSRTVFARPVELRDGETLRVDFP